MQSLYEQEWHPEQSLVEIGERNRRLSAAGTSDDDAAYIASALEGLAAEKNTIDGLIVKHAPEWPLEQIAAVDRAVLRVGIYELLYSEGVPPKVAINEAVEIAKAYGGENSGSFVNGVLGTVYRASPRYDPKQDKSDKSDKPTKPTKPSKSAKARVPKPPDEPND